MKKRTKKLLVLWRAMLEQHATASKSFLLLFFKKEALAFLPVALLVIAGAAPRPAVMRDIAYGPDPAERLDLCMPPGVPASTTAVIAIHGGGLFSGDKSLLTSRVCSWFGPRGVAVISVNYRLADGTNRGRWPASLADVQLAVRWFRRHAGDYGLNIQRLCAVGGSAGGHLAALLDVLAAPVPADVSGLLPGISPAVDCAVNQWGPADFTAPSPLMRKEMGLLLPGESPAAIADQTRSMSPIFSVHKGIGPMLLVQGLSDPATPPRQAEDFLHVLEQNGVPAHLITFAGKHGLPSDAWNRMGIEHVVPFVVDGVQ